MFASPVSSGPMAHSHSSPSVGDLISNIAGSGFHTPPMAGVDLIKNGRVGPATSRVSMIEFLWPLREAAGSRPCPPPANGCMDGTRKRQGVPDKKAAASPRVL